MNTHITEKPSVENVTDGFTVLVLILLPVHIL